ncbi:related to RO-10 protein, required for nuclear distribution [Ramularia collo-cygni]|uniref:Related to RO-10 protein, required for nuclear distribution n=1 Tax=Ramularia collo-cygni TaxID=112498 RepID=A0A2D3V6Q6_9PEZI|nr:related to RO-10 protein, required for nuclear distribution [Ramularia collo-cygni]CZT25086.1 related to RO-10 protein, required for nuclear distribution [Ramularia collo-cygni]
MANSHDTATQTLLMLEERLQHVDYLVNGDGEAAAAQRRAIRSTSTSTGSATARLRNLEKALKALAAKSYAVSDLLQLHKQHPDLFHPTDPQTVPSTLPPAALAQLVLAHEQLYKSSATQLTMLNDNSAIPDPTVMAKLVALQPRIDKVEAKQRQQLQEFHDLRVRSMRVVEGWCEKGVLEMGGNWADWEENLRECEILVRRNEAAKRREDDFK